jgi:hypothetical protein
MTAERRHLLNPVVRVKVSGVGSRPGCKAIFKGVLVAVVVVVVVVVWMKSVARERDKLKKGE